MMNNHYDRETLTIEDPTAERLMNRALSITGEERAAVIAELQQHLKAEYGIDYTEKSPELADATDTESEALWRVERDSNRSPAERFAAHTARMETIGDTLGWFLVACLALLTMPGAFTVGIAVTAFAVIMLASIAAVRLVSLATE
ncbi:hypothetical protein [Streptomyces sp. NPDC051677]|uniref:hypothetical protein n=1 Tax=Streptomyces sp. NPDC051677 TaxID=3365669 RepID=UPI0037D7FAB7